MELLKRLLRRRKYILVRISTTGKHGLQVLSRGRKKPLSDRDLAELNAQERFWDTGEILKIREL